MLWELLNAFSLASTRRLAAEAYRRIHQDAMIEVVNCDPPLQQRAIGLYNSRPDKSWGVTDCLSFTVMGDRGVPGALTNDHHFEQAGFLSLLRGDPP